MHQTVIVEQPQQPESAEALRVRLEYQQQQAAAREARFHQVEKEIAELRAKADLFGAIDRTKLALWEFPRNAYLKQTLKELKRETKGWKRVS